MINEISNQHIITDVSVSAREYIKKNYQKEVQILSVIAIIWFCIMIFISVVFALVVPLIIFFGLYAYIYTKIRHEFMEQFAKLNQFSYESVGSYIERTGTIFNRGRAQELEDLITGKFENYNFELYNYQYTEGSGKNSHTYYFTVFQVHFNHHVPHLMMTKKIFGFPLIMATNFSDGRSLRLEGNFNSQFSVTVEKEYEIEALQILTPEFMQHLMLVKDFSFEFFNQDLYIYRGGYVTKKADLNLMYQLTTYLIEKLSPRLSRMSDSVKAMDEQRVKF